MQLAVMNVKLRSNWQLVIIHLLFWLVYVLYQAVSYNWENTDSLDFVLPPQVLVVSIPVTIIAAYLNLYVLLPLFYYRRQYIRYAFAILLLLLLSGLSMRYLTHTYILPWEKLHNPVRYAQENKHFWIPVRILRMALQTYPVIAFTTLLQLMYRAFHQEKDLRELEKEKYSAEIAFLKAQINPHFFFNTLNSLYALTLKGSDLASKVVLHLSQLMRYMIYDAGADKVLLKHDIDHIGNYIKIEQMRFADRLDLSFNYSGDIEHKMIAPLLLLPLVENAFKHGIEEDAGWVTIHLKVTGNRLFLKVENSYPKNIKTSGNGLGLRNVKRRLELIYPGQYQLQLNRTEESFEADLKINL
ncbi:sensor histidine kinase [Chitinophaga sp. S165]|uniref:sensor histidine kinase n=1 Tax=Chitinophaga sp. S165 TaxID=2135462 RepID=UPI000D71A014|nr:histidine kinase [Chitinophaga sp. S165]PWV49053.1 histidine kinase [Chitinophaga sp. S165]